MAAPQVRHLLRLVPIAKGTAALGLMASDAWVDPDGVRPGAADLPARFPEAVLGFHRSAWGDAPEPRDAHQRLEPLRLDALPMAGRRCLVPDAAPELLLPAAAREFPLERKWVSQAEQEQPAAPWAAPDESE